VQNGRKFNLTFIKPVISKIRDYMI